MKDRNDDESEEEYEPVQVYNDPKADTVIVYDDNGDQHVYVKDD